jgi:hypothetical protein
VNDRAPVLNGSSAEKRRRISIGSVASHRADFHFPSTQVWDNRQTVLSEEVLFSGGTPVPSTPSRSFRSSKSPSFSPAQQMCSLNQECQTLVAMDYMSPSLADSAWRDRSSPSGAANGISAVLISGQGFEQNLEAHPSKNRNDRHAKTDNGSLSSGLRYLLRSLPSSSSSIFAMFAESALFYSDSVV